VLEPLHHSQAGSAAEGWRVGAEDMDGEGNRGRLAITEAARSSARLLAEHRGDARFLARGIAMTELEPLLKRIEQLTPYFGRAQDDLVALTTRGRNRDYKGVLQNARLVLEALLRSLVTTELKQTPGKAMLDELLNKFRQQAHSGGVVPIHILGHMGTVQAWGNLSSHDQSGGLNETGVRVDLQEVVASLNSLVAVLTWYKERFVPEPSAPLPAASVESPARAPEARSPGGRRVAWVGGVSLVALAAGLGVVAYRSAPEPGSSAPPADPRSQVDALYTENGEPLPPAECQETDAQALQLLLEVAPRLSARVPEADRRKEATVALEALRARGSWKPEGWFHVARASLLASGANKPAMESALLCEGFVAAETLAGKMAATGGDWKASAVHHEHAEKLAPRFWKAPFNLGLAYLQMGRVDEAVSALERAEKLAPAEVADLHFALGLAYKAKGEQDRARSAFCRSKELGNKTAAALCAP
jgi:hypothetical protein